MGCTASVEGGVNGRKRPRGRLRRSTTSFDARQFRYGVTLEVLERVGRLEGVNEMTTAEVSHNVLTPLTVPTGWKCRTEIDFADRRKVNIYTNKRGVESETPPHGTFSYAEGLHRAKRTRRCVSRPTIFISHAWSYQWSVLLGAIRAFVATEELDPEKTYFWIDIFCVNQHVTDSRPPEWWSSIFKDAVRAIGWTVVVLSPWDNPKPLTRAWCLWEIYCTLATNSKFSVALSKTEEDQFALSLHSASSTGAVHKAFAHIEAANAEADSLEDRNMIMDAIESTVGFSEMNSLIMEALRNWMRATVRLRITSKTDTLRLRSSTESIEHGSSMKRSDSARKRYHARQVQREASEPPTGSAHAQLPSPLWSKDPGATQGTMDEPPKLDRVVDQEWARNLSPALFTADDGESQSRFQAAATAVLNGFSAEPRKRRAPIIDTTLQDFEELVREADTLTDLSDIGAAIEMFEGVRARASHLGEDHPVILTVKSRLALLQHEMGHKAEAKVLYEEALQGLIRTLGPANITTINTQHNLAVLLGEVGGDLKQVKSSLESVVARLAIIEVEAAGDELSSAEAVQARADSLGARMSLADVLTKLGEKDEALSIYEDIIQQYEVLPGFGPNHKDTLLCQHNMGACLAELGESDVEFTRARIILEQVCRKFREILGPDQPQTTTSRCTYAFALEQSGDIAGAAAEYWQSHVALTSVLGSDHARTLFVGNSLKQIGSHEWSMAAIVIQAAFRGFRTRRRLAAGESGIEEENGESTDSGSSDDSEDETSEDETSQNKGRKLWKILRKETFH